MTFSIISESLKNGGILGLYKGLFSTTILASYGMIQMTLYNSIKYKIEARHKFKKYMASLVGIFSRVIASVILYPFNLVRTRQQQFDPNSSNIKEDVKMNIYFPKIKYGLFISSIKIIFKNEGFYGFYKGLTID